MHKTSVYLIDFLFDFSLEKSFDEAMIFCFIYFVFGEFIIGVSSFVIISVFRLFFTDISALPPSMFYIATSPFVLALLFFLYVAIQIVLKKKLKDVISLNLLFLTIAFTLYMPIVLSIRNGFIDAYTKWFLPGMLLSFIPIAILSMKEDCSLNKQIKEMEKEKFEHERWIEQQLLTERASANKIEQIKKHINNAENKKD